MSCILVFVFSFHIVFVLYISGEQLEKLLDPTRLRMMCFQICLWPHETLTFDLLTSKVDSFIPVPPPHPYLHLVTSEM